MAITIIIIIIIAVIIAAYVLKAQGISKAKQAYDRALQGQNKREALEAGRKYYSKLRKDGKLTIYDEQAITNDIAAMDSVR